MLSNHHSSVMHFLATPDLLCCEVLSFHLVETNRRPIGHVDSEAALMGDRGISPPFRHKSGMFIKVGIFDPGS